MQRPVRCAICDSEGGGLPTGQRYSEAEVRNLVLMRRVGELEPSWIYAGRLPPTLTVSEVPGLYRQLGSFQN